MDKEAFWFIESSPIVSTPILLRYVSIVMCSSATLHHNYTMYIYPIKTISFDSGRPQQCHSCNIRFAYTG